MSTTHDLANDLATAVDGPDIFAVYQPQVSLDSGSIVAAEALCRWRHPRLGDVDRETMIDVAERSGVIHALGRRMLDECLDTLTGWRDTGRDWAVAVNVSPLQLTDESFARHVVAELTRRGLPAPALVLEVTQAEASLAERTVLRQLGVLSDAGVEISLAGYGADSPPLELLRSLPLSEAKVPGHLVRAAEGAGLASLREHVETAHAHGMRVVAEGIETLTHLDVAVQLGCDRAQGFLIRQPDAEIEFP